MASTTARITVTLPAQLVEEIDRFETNRRKFVVEGVRREVHRRRREALRRSLESSHVEGAQSADEGFDEWARSLPDDAEDLVNLSAGTPVRWTPGRGWLKGGK